MNLSAIIGTIWPCGLRMTSASKRALKSGSAQALATGFGRREIWSYPSWKVPPFLGACLRQRLRLRCGSWRRPRRPGCDQRADRGPL